MVLFARLRLNDRQAHRSTRTPISKIAIAAQMIPNQIAIPYPWLEGRRGLESVESIVGDGLGDVVDG